MRLIAPLLRHRITRKAPRDAGRSLPAQPGCGRPNGVQTLLCDTGRLHKRRACHCPGLRQASLRPPVDHGQTPL